MNDVVSVHRLKNQAGKCPNVLVVVRVLNHSIGGMLNQSSVVKLNHQIAHVSNDQYLVAPHHEKCSERSPHLVFESETYHPLTNHLFVDHNGVTNLGLKFLTTTATPLDGHDGMMTCPHGVSVL
jgi:hypothetical protein